MKFQRESLFDVIGEVQPLLERHYEELCANKDVVKLDPDWATYRALEEAGRFLIYTGREDGKLAAYSAFFVGAHIHYRSLIVAQNDVFFIAPEHRLGMTALRFLRFAHNALKQGGARKIVYHCKSANNFAPILERLDFKTEETMCAKLI